MMKTVYHMRSCIENTVQLRNAVFFIGYFRLYLTGVRYFCMRSMVSVSSPPCLRYALHMFTAVAKLIL
jgi:hypothetical protein